MFKTTSFKSLIATSFYVKLRHIHRNKGRVTYQGPEEVRLSLYFLPMWPLEKTEHQNTDSQPCDVHYLEKMFSSQATTNETDKLDKNSTNILVAKSLNKIIKEDAFFSYWRISDVDNKLLIENRKTLT